MKVAEDKIKTVRRNWTAERRGANSWKTDEGTSFICTGPIGWSHERAFERLARYGLDVARVNERLTEKLFEELPKGFICDLVDDLECELMEEQEERNQHSATETPS